MSPIEFVLFNGDSNPNQPVYQIAEAMQNHIKILGPACEYRILSYYCDDGKMVLEIEEVVE